MEFRAWFGFSLEPAIGVSACFKVEGRRVFLGLPGEESWHSGGICALGGSGGKGTARNDSRARGTV